MAFVLSGGANLGAAQAGMLEALLEAGIVPDLLVGTSIGAVNAAYMAAGPTPDRAAALSEVWRRISVEEFFPLRAAQVSRAILAGGLFSPAPLRRLLEQEIPFRLVEEAMTPLRIVATRCERLPGLPLRIVTTRFEQRTEEVFAAGPVLDALLASSALPLVFPPHHVDGHVYVDGGLSEYVPLHPALDAGARTIYVLSLGAARSAASLDHPRRSAVYRSLGNRFWRRESLVLAEMPLTHPDVRVVTLPCPPVHAGLRDFSRMDALIDKARDDVLRFLDDALGQTA